MSDSGADRLVQQFSQVIASMSGQQAERTITEMLIQARQYSDELTPIDTGNLINSGYRNVRPLPNGYEGTVGYTAKYAGWVHEMSGKLKGQPRSDFAQTREGVAFGGGTGVGRYWDPNAEPKFLAKGRDKMIREDAENIIRRNMEPRL